MGGKSKKKIKQLNDDRKDSENDTEISEVIEETLEFKNEDEAIASKRYHTDDESENEPIKKKKKKKATVTSDTNDKKSKTSIRQAKREKHAQRQADSQAAAKKQLKSQCLSYLSQWKHNRQNWKFMKSKQVWLYKNKFSENLLPDESWPLLLEYFESARGNIRNMLLEDANKIIKQMDDWTEEQGKEEKIEDDETEEAEESKKPSEICYKRARDLIQFLQE